MAQEPLTTASSSPITDSTLSPPSTSSSSSELSDISSEPFVRRPSHSRKRQEGHIPRPPNAFMLYRSDFWRRYKEHPFEKDHRRISCIAAICWKALSQHERAVFEAYAEDEKRRHAEKYPGYKYAPSSGKAKFVKKKVVKKNVEEDEKCGRVASLIMRGCVGSDLEREIQKMSIGSSSPSASPSPTPTPPRRLRPSTARRTKKPASPVTSLVAESEVAPKLEVLRTPELSLNHFTCSYTAGDEFIPTNDIPRLDLPAPLVKPAEPVCISPSIWHHL